MTSEEPRGPEGEPSGRIREVPIRRRQAAKVITLEENLRLVQEELFGDEPPPGQ
jgi:hypothetical protein